MESVATAEHKGLKAIGRQVVTMRLKRRNSLLKASKCFGVLFFHLSIANDASPLEAAREG